MGSSLGTVIGALIVAFALVVAGFLAGGSYAVTVGSGWGPAEGQNALYEVDRFTGAIRMCFYEGVAKQFLCYRSEANDLSPK
jgi:hypothetical protein